MAYFEAGKDAPSGMSHGLILFARLDDAPGLRPVVEAGLAALGARRVAIAYASDQAAAAARSALAGLAGVRFFPQAARETTGERVAQALAFLFVQDFERLTLLTAPGLAPGPEPDADGVAIAEGPGGYAFSVERRAFPRLAAALEAAAFDAPGALSAARRALEAFGEP